MQATQLQVGKKFDEYIIESLLGQGGFGAVFLARHQTITVPTPNGSVPWMVAIKELFDQHQISRFRQEAGILIQLTSRIPALTHVYSMKEVNQHGFLIMEYIPGGTLQFAVDRRGSNFLESQLLHIAVDLAETLKQMHQFQPPVVHRDVKPENIKVFFDGANIRVRLLDLGIAAILMGNPQREVVGTYAYASPQQMRGELPDFYMDQHSLGATLLYAMMPYALSAEQKILPFPFVSWRNASERDAVLRTFPRAFAEQVKDRFGGKFPDIWDHQQQLEAMLAQCAFSADFKAIIRRMLADNAVDKYQSMSEVEVAFRQLLNGNTTSLKPGIPRPPSSPTGGSAPPVVSNTSGAVLPFKRTTTK